MRDILAAAVDLVLPRACVGCGWAGELLCPSCRVVRRVRRTTSSGVVVCSAGAYGGALRQALLAYKERGRRDLARCLAPLLAGAVQGLALPSPPSARAAPLLVAVPTTRARAASRGGDHIARLARGAAGPCGLRFAPGVLRHVRAVSDSAGLGAAERASNLQGAFAARPRPGGVAVLVDDIVTSSATLDEACRALAEAGWRVAGAATVAATPRRHAAPQ